jgi:HTH-type transcriptional regulator, competence development regulator
MIWSRGVYPLTIGEYIGILRKDKGLNMRQLADLSGVSQAALSRIESGEREKPRPLLLKALAPHLGVTYEQLMAKAGYIEETVERERYLEKQFRDDDGTLADVVRQSKTIIDRDQDLFRVLSRAASKLSSDDLSAIKTVISSFIDDASEEDATALRTVVRSLTKNIEQK